MCPSPDLISHYNYDEREARPAKSQEILIEIMGKQLLFLKERRIYLKYAEHQKQ